MSNQENPSLGIQDIKNALSVIDYAAEQGAFKGWGTIEQVIAVRTRLNNFVNFAQQQLSENAEASEATETSDATEATLEPATETNEEALATAVA